MGNTRMNLLNRAGALLFVENPNSEGGGAGEPKSSDGPPDSNGNARSAGKTYDDDGNEVDDDEPLGEGGIKALKSERKRASEEKRRADAAEARLKEIDDADKSELQRAQERVAELEKANQAYEDERTRRDLRSTVVATKNVPSEWADFVTGDTEDEMTKSADRILANLAGADEGPDLHGTRGKTGGSIEAGREAAKSFRP